jgi:toxin ParE1/3/4
MTPRYNLLPAADRDLDDQAGYLAQHASLEVALRFYDAAAASFATLARMPAMGERWRSAAPRLEGLRVWRVEGFPKHLIFYRPSTDGIDVVRVLHGAHDLDTALEDDA